MKKIIITAFLLIGLLGCEKEYSGRSPYTVITVLDSQGNIVNTYPVEVRDTITVGDYRVIIKESRR